MSKTAFAVFAAFCVLLFGGAMYLFVQPTDVNGWVAYFVMLMINPGILLGIIATEVDW